MKAGYDQKSGSINVKQDSGYSQSFKADPGSNKANASGVSRRDSAMMQLLNADRTPCTNGNPAYLELAQKNGSTQLFSAATGGMVSLRTKNGAVMTAESYQSQVQVQKDTFGQITRIDSERDGRMEFERTSNKLTMKHYSRTQVAAQRARGLGMAGSPAKMYSYEWNAASRTMNIVNQEAGKEPVYIERKVENTPAGKKVTIMKGLGDERIVTIYEQNDLPGGKWEEIKTVKGINDSLPTSCVRTVKKSTEGGWLILSVTEGYGTALAQTTTYTYNDQYRVSLELNPNGGYTQYEYDAMGRVVMEASPWTDGEFLKMIRTTYADLRFNDYRPQREVVVLKHRDGSETEVQSTEYEYGDSVQVNRVTRIVSAPGATSPLMTIEETYGEAAVNEYSRGRVKMKQDEQGIQHVYMYENTSDYGSAWKVTRETQVNGAIVPSQSQRSVKYHATDETVVREEEYAHTGSGWSLISTANYEYDDQKRRIKTVRGNGRISTAKWGCCGPLEKIDEDGVKLSYGYNTSRQLVEVIRSATETTPEKIVSYTRNAVGRDLEVRTDIGALTRIIKNSYDIQGRLISQIDEHGRCTTYSYSQDGLTITKTIPTGATFITKLQPDGSVFEHSGTGQQHVRYETSIVEDGICVTEKIVAGDYEYSPKMTVANALNQILRVGKSLAKGGFIFERYSYNEKGQLVQKATDGMAPTLYEYDSLGKVTKEVLKLASIPSFSNSKIITYDYLMERKEDGIYASTVVTKNNGKGGSYRKKKSELISSLSPVLQQKTITVDPRGVERIKWKEYCGPYTRQFKEKLPESAITSVVCEVDGFISSKTDTAGNTVTYIRSISASGVHFEITDVRGNTSLVDQNIIDLTKKMTDAAGNVTMIEYDPMTSKPFRVTDALGKTACYAYDQRGRKIAEWGESIQPAVYEYDDANRLVSFTTFRASGEIITTDPTGRSDGDTTTWTYHEASGLLLKKCYADGTAENYTYDDCNRMVTKQQSRAIGTAEMFLISTYDYDPQSGNLLSITHNDGTPAVSYAYNHLGHLTGITDDSGIRNLSYNEYNEMTEESTEGLVNSVLEYHLDTLGRSAGYALQYGDKIVQQSRLSYDSCGRYSTVSLNQVEVPFQFGYNTSNGLLDTLDYPNEFTRLDTREDKRNFVAKIAYLHPESINCPAKVDYAYDELGRPVMKNDFFDDPNPDMTHSYTYNDRGGMTSDVMSRGGAYSYCYDNIGNRESSKEGAGTSTIYSTNGMNQYNEITAEAGMPFVPEYDADGNQTEIKTSTGEWVVSYNALNQATSFTQGKKRIECRYDYMSRRVERSAYEGDNLLSRKYFLYKGYLQVAELDTHNATETAPPVLRKTYLWDPRETTATRILAMTRFNESGDYEEDLYYTHDLLKNTIALFDIKGCRQGMYEYGPYGDILKLEGKEAEENPFRFSCEYSESELGLVYYNYRYFNTKDGRWIGRDLLKEQSSANLYSFGINCMPATFDVLGAWNDGLGGKAGPKADRGHSDFPGHDRFDYTREDHDDETEPFNPKATWRHFRPLADSEKDLANAVKNCDKDAFERHSHQMQDFFSHYGQGFRAEPYGKSMEQSGSDLAYAALMAATPSVPLSSYELKRLEDAADVMQNYPTGHLWPSVAGKLPGNFEPDNAEDFEDAFNQAEERSNMWVNKWDECCCEKNGIPTQRTKEDGSPACQDVPVPENPYGDKAAPPKKPEPPKKRNRIPSIDGFPLQLPPFDPGGIV